MKCRIQMAMVAIAASMLVAPAAFCATLDGQNIPSEGITLRATQDSPTAFGDATGGGQDSAGGSELDQLFADIDNGVLTLGITGNLEGNFNKMFIFFDAVAGGENTLAGDNADNGFGEINGLAGLSFPANVTMDHGLRLEVGGGFLGVNGFDLIDNSAFSIWTAGGPGDLPLSNVGSGGVTFGWDNSNILGVTGATAASAATATTGFEFEIDMATFFGSSDQQVRITALITSGDGTFASNQILPGINSTDNLGSPSGQTIGAVGVPVPEPSAVCLGLLGLTTVALARRR